MDHGVYRIKDWVKLFENNRTRELKHLNWIPLPAKLDGDGYTELVDDKNGAGLYGCWCACVIIAGRCDPRGTLMRATNVPHDCTSLARISRLDRGVMQKMLDKALTIGWLEVMDIAPSCEIPAHPCPLPNPNPNPNPNPKKKRPSFDAKEIILPDPLLSLSEDWITWCSHRQEIGKPLTETSVAEQIKKFETWGAQRSRTAIQHTVANGWQGIREPDSDGKPASPKPTRISK